MKICFVATSSVSIDSFMLPVAVELKARGAEMTFVTACQPGFRERCAGVAEVFDYQVARGFDFAGTLKSALRLRKLCRSKRFDLVVYTTPNGALYGSIGSWLAGVPARVLAQWGMRYVGYEGWRRKFIRAIEKISCRLATDIRNVSEKNRAIAIADGMYKPEKCKVLGKGGTIGVDLEQYNLADIPPRRRELREKLGIPDSALVYGFVGRIRRDKGVNELFHAFRELRKSNDNAWLFLLGGTDIDAGIEADVFAEMQADPHVILYGAVPTTEVCKCMAAFDVLVHPTYREGFGMVLQEAAAMQLPTITTDIPGASEAIVDQVTGLLVRKGDVPTLQQAMLAMADESLRKSLGCAGRKRIEADFERNMMVNRMCDDYLAIIRQRVQTQDSEKA